MRGAIRVSAIVAIAFGSSLLAQAGQRYLIAAWGEEREFSDCSRHVPVSGLNQTRIPICLKGNGRYDLDAVALVQGRRWFSGIGSELSLENQVSEVRFVCSLRSGQQRATLTSVQVVFPSRDEAHAGAKIRIDIPCGLSAPALDAQMRSAVELIRSSLTRPQQVVNATDQVIATCGAGFGGTEPETGNCRMWKTLVGEILSGEAAQDLGAPLASCGTMFTFGLGRNSTDRATTAPADSGDFLSGVEIDDFGRDWAKFYRFLSHCYLANLDDETGAVLSFDRRSSNAACSADLKALAEALARRGVELLPDGRVRVNGRTLAANGTHQGLEALVLGFVAELQAETDFRYGHPPSKDAQRGENRISGTEEQWRRALSRLKVGTVVQKTKTQTATSTRGLDPTLYSCGTDTACHRIFSLAQSRFHDETMALGEGCFELVHVSYLPDQQEPKFTFRDADPAKCRSE